MRQLTPNEYRSLHYWIARNKQKTGYCSSCGIEKTTEWSNVSGKYLRELSDWQELCKKCHYKYDVTVLGKQAYGGDKKNSFTNKTAAKYGKLGGSNSKRGNAPQRNSKKILYNNVIFYPSQLARHLNTSRQDIANRIKRGEFYLLP